MVRIFNVLLLISSACALKSPRALKVRGGHNTYSLDTLTKVGAGLFGVSGAAAYITPKQNFKAYDMTVPSARRPLSVFFLNRAYR